MILAVDLKHSTGVCLSEAEFWAFSEKQMSQSLTTSLLFQFFELSLTGMGELPDSPKSAAVLPLILNCHINLCHEHTKPMEKSEYRVSLSNILWLSFPVMCIEVWFHSDIELQNEGNCEKQWELTSEMELGRSVYIVTKYKQKSHLTYFLWSCHCLQFRLFAYCFLLTLN